MRTAWCHRAESRKEEVVTDRARRGEPQASLAAEYGVSAERIRQLEANALKKMKALFAA